MRVSLEVLRVSGRARVAHDRAYARGLKKADEVGKRSSVRSVVLFDFTSKKRARIAVSRRSRAHAHTHTLVNTHDEAVPPLFFSFSFSNSSLLRDNNESAC